MGPEANILEPSAEQCCRLWLDSPILSLYDIRVLKKTNYRGWKVRIVGKLRILVEVLENVGLVLLIMYCLGRELDVEASSTRHTGIVVLIESMHIGP